MGAMSLESFELVMLRRPPNAAQYDDATLERIQAEHLAYHATLREQGKIVTNGPLMGQPDEALRGLTFYRVGSVQEARRLAEQDPSVKAGRLVVDVMQWLCPTGTMALPGHPFVFPE
jgi:uncharacterized protein YciI